MYLFTRQGRLTAGSMLQGMEWVGEMTAKVNQVTSLNVGVWSPVMSPGLGTLSFGCQAESLGDLEDADAKLTADPIYLDLVQRGAQVTTGEWDDQVAQFIHNPGADPAATHVAVVKATVANGKFRRGVEVGVEIAEKATSISGVPTAFLLGTTGQYGGCAWISAATSIREIERSEQAINSDPAFLELVDTGAAECYLPGSGTQTIWRKIA